MKQKIAIVCLALLCAGVPSRALSDEYDSRRAGHPVQVVAHVLHPFGVILDRAIFRPAWRLGHWGPVRHLFGFVPRRDEPVEQPSPSED